MSKNKNPLQQAVEEASRSIASGGPGNELNLPPKDLTYRVLMERSAQIKAGDSAQTQQWKNTETPQTMTEDERELLRLVAGCGLACVNNVPELVVSFEAEILAHYRKATRRRTDAVMALARVSGIVAHNGCDCDCGHHHEEHDDDCERCLGCEVSEALSDYEQDQRALRVAEIVEKSHISKEKE